MNFLNGEINNKNNKMKKLFLKLIYNKRRRRKIYEMILNKILTKTFEDMDVFICNELPRYLSDKQKQYLFKELFLFRFHMYYDSWISSQLRQFDCKNETEFVNETRIFILQTCVEMTK